MQFLRTCTHCLRTHERRIWSRFALDRRQFSAEPFGHRNRLPKSSHKSRPEILLARRQPYTLYTPISEADHAPFVLKPEIDFEKVFGDLDELEANVKSRGHEVNLVELVALWEKLQRLELEKSDIEDRRSKIIQDIKDLKKKGGDVKQNNELQQTGRSLREELRQVNVSISSLSDEFYPTALKLPNNLHPAVPHGASIHILETFGAEPETFSSTSSMEHSLSRFLTESHSLAHAGFAYLDHDVSLIEYALTQWARQELQDQGFVPFSCPAMYKPIALEALGLDANSDNETYAIETHDNIQYLAGVSPLAFIAYYMMSVMEVADLPYRCFTVGRSYNSQLESTDFTGLHTSFQTQKVEVCGVCESTPTASNALFTQFLTMLKGQLTRLPLCYRIVEVPSARLLPSMHRKCAVEVWIPDIGEFKEVASVSNCTDYISRRVKMRYPAIPTQTAAQSRRRNFLHTVHCTVLDTSILLAALLPYAHQLPEALKPHMPQPITTREDST